MFQKLRTVIYHVTDLEKAKEWYTSLTGEQPYFDEPFYVGFDINGCELGLDPDMEHIQEGNQSIAYWSVNNIEEAFSHALELDAKIIQPVTNVGCTIETAIVEDPFGNHIGLISGA